MDELIEIMQGLIDAKDLVCPFCGCGTSIRVCTSQEFTSPLPDYKVVCDATKGGCGGSSGFRHTKRQAVEAWVMRRAS